jgi:hypothetical protein
MKLGKRKTKWRLLVWGLLLGAVATEYNKPEDQRTGTGVVAGFVPYDFRAPTVQRFRYALWNPQDSRILIPHPFGVGWTINFGRLWALWQGSAEIEPPSPEPLD